jgi:hypothetical protein
MSRRHTIGFLTAAAVVVTSLAMPPWAWARYGSSGSETNSFTTGILATPFLTAVCGTGLLKSTVNLSWTLTSSWADGYEIRYGPSASNPSVTVVPSGGRTTQTYSTPNLTGIGDYFFTVTGTRSLWRSPVSNQVSKNIFAIIGLGTCS